MKGTATPTELWGKPKLQLKRSLSTFQKGGFIVEQVNITMNSSFFSVKTLASFSLLHSVNSLDDDVSLKAFDTKNACTKM